MKYGQDNYTLRLDDEKDRIRKPAQKNAAHFAVNAWVRQRRCVDTLESFVDAFDEVGAESCASFFVPKPCVF